MNIINEFYVKDSSKKVTTFMQHKGESSEYLTTNPPYGYMKDPADSKRHWLIDKKAAATVRQILPGAWKVTVRRTGRMPCGTLPNDWDLHTDESSQ